MSRVYWKLHVGLSINTGSRCDCGLEKELIYFDIDYVGNLHNKFISPIIHIFAGKINHLILFLNFSQGRVKCSE